MVAIPPRQELGPIDFVTRAVRDLASKIGEWDYEITNESEFSHLFFHVMLGTAVENGLSARTIRSEIRLFGGGSVDFGLSTEKSKNSYVALAEMKVWFRPVDASPWSKRNQSTSKRKQCIADAQRLLQLLRTGSSQTALLLVLERSSTHLRRFLGRDLKEAGIYFEETWIDTCRAALGRRKEHVGIVWIALAPDQLVLSNPRVNSDAPRAARRLRATR